MAVARDKEDMRLRFQDHHQSSGEGLTRLLRSNRCHSCISVQIQCQTLDFQRRLFPISLALFCRSLRGGWSRRCVSRALDVGSRKLRKESMSDLFFLRVHSKDSLHHPCAGPYNAMLRPYQVIVHRTGHPAFVDAYCPFVVVFRGIRREDTLCDKIGYSRRLVEAERSNGCHGGLISSRCSSCNAPSQTVLWSKLLNWSFRPCSLGNGAPATGHGC